MRWCWPTVLGSGLMVGLLAWDACFSIAEGVFGERAGNDPLFPWVASITLTAVRSDGAWCSCASAPRPGRMT